MKPRWDLLAILAGEQVVDRAIETLRRREQFRQVRRTNVARPRDAELDVGNRREGGTCLPRGHVAREAVAGGADSRAEVPTVGKGCAADEGDDGFDRPFGDRLLPV